MEIRLFTLPNLLTICNLLSGSLAALFALTQGDLKTSFYLVILAAFFDFFDGFVARLTNSYSAVGKELDSLADMVSFGFTPSAILYTIYQGAGGDEWIGYLSFVLVACSALRLAKFNVDESQSEQFIGLPTPAAALFVAAVGYLFVGEYFTVQPNIVVGTAFMLSYFLICNTPMFALKFKQFGFRGNEVRYIFILLALVSLLIWQVVAIPFIILAYIGTSIFMRHLSR